MKFSFFNYPLIAHDSKTPQAIAYPKFAPSRIIHKPLKLKTEQYNNLLLPKTASVQLSSRMTQRLRLPEKSLTQKCQQGIQTDFDLEFESQDFNSPQIEQRKTNTFKHYLNYKARIILPVHREQTASCNQRYIDVGPEQKFLSQKLVTLKKIKEIVRKERKEQINQIQISTQPVWQYDRSYFPDSASRKVSGNDTKLHNRFNSMSSSVPNSRSKFQKPSKKQKIISYARQSQNLFLGTDDKFEQSKLQTDETFDQYVSQIKST